MGSLVVRNVPDSVKERLKRRAKRHGRSMEAEAREILRNAVHEPEKPQYGLGTEIANLFKRLGPAPKIRKLRFKMQVPHFGE